MDLDSTDVRKFLGIDRMARDIKALREIPSLLNRLEFMMATAKEQLDNLSVKVDDLVADVRAAREALEADRDNLSDEGQEALDTLSAKLDAFDAEVGDADGSDVPAEEPVTEEPTVPVDTGEDTSNR